MVHDYNGKIILNGPITLLNDINADGIHLPSTTYARENQRPFSNDYILSVACHDQEQLEHAELITADIALLSPIFTTPSSPKGKPIGWEKFSQLVQSVKIPIYALGGLKTEDYLLAKPLGAYGIAAKRALWNLQKSHLLF